MIMIVCRCKFFFAKALLFQKIAVSLHPLNKIFNHSKTQIYVFGFS